MFVRVLPVGNVSQQLLDIIKSELEDNLNIKSRILPKADIPKDSYNTFRKQYNAEKLMDVVLNEVTQAKFIDRSIPTLLITELDLYYEGLTFVFGLENPTRGSTIVSLARLKPEFYNERPNPYLLRERAIKEVIHELGHYLGLEHCEHEFCVMHFSPSVKDVDSKKKEFCSECKVKMMTRGINLE